MSAFKSILLVGSVPLASSEAVFRMLASKLGYLREEISGRGRRVIVRTGFAGSATCSKRHPNFELENPDPTIAGIRDAQTRPIFKLKDRTADIELGALGYAKEAILVLRNVQSVEEIGRAPAGHEASGQHPHGLWRS